MSGSALANPLIGSAKIYMFNLIRIYIGSVFQKQHLGINIYLEQNDIAALPIKSCDYWRSE